MNEYQEIEAKKRQLETEIAAWQTERENFRQIVQEWRENKEGWQLILRGGNDAIWDWNIRENRLFLSPRWKEMLGYTDKEIASNFDTWKNLLHPQDLDRTVKALQAYLEKIVPEYRVEFRLRCKDGSYKWILARGEAIWDEEGNPTRMAGSHTDITERTEREKALKQAKESADTANRAKSEFLASMSHELRTPLNAILGFTQVMSRDATLNSEQRDYLEIINRSGEHLLELINDILEMSKIEAGKTSLIANGFDLYRLLDDLEEMLRLKADAKNLKLIFERSAAVPHYIYTDERKLRQVLINLLGNALKFTEIGGVTLRVGVKEEKPEQLYFEVEDTGPGIASEEVDKLFEAFTQMEVGRKSQQGTGLGLAISKKFVELMQGNIRVSSILGSGSLFAFDILVELADAKDIESKNTPHKVTGLAPNQPIYRILVVDDRLESRLLMIKLLSTMGFLVQQASNGQEALLIWQTWNPHLIWMDMRMPVMDGYETTQRIKSTPKGQSTVIIALTASVFEEDQTMILSTGCDDFVRKPFREEILWEKMSQHLGVHFTYQTQNPIIHQSQENVSTENLHSQLTQMPQEWLNQLQKAAQECNDEKIIELSEKIPLKYPQLKDTLKEWANNFSFDSILDLRVL